jgi:hypothetical protein
LASPQDLACLAPGNPSEATQESKRSNMIKAVRTPVDSLDDLCLRLLTQIQKMNYIQAQSFKCCKSLVEFHLQGSILAHFIT